MAGGGGTRLWPVSRKKHPKHVLPLLGERTLFQNTLDRLGGFIPPERIYVDKKSGITRTSLYRHLPPRPAEPLTAGQPTERPPAP